MKTNPRIHRGFTLVELLVVIVIIAALAGLTAPMVIRQRKKADQTEAVSNARQIGLALIEFETEYGNFPDSDTAKKVADATETTLVSGNTANDRFRQLIRGGFTQNEQMFYAKAAYTKKPDGIVTDTKGLEKGEVGFGIIVNSDDTGMSAAGNSSRPIVMAPFDVALSGEKFDFDVYDGKAVVLKLDNSVTSIQIVKSTGKVKINGLDLFAKSEDSVWGTTTSPKMAYPISK
jgi:prepilin-type N-terminal cleavage/methylation domain-containing protein